jgi:hypothetical protein
MTPARPAQRIECARKHHAATNAVAIEISGPFGLCGCLNSGRNFGFSPVEAGPVIGIGMPSNQKTQLGAAGRRSRSA